MPPSGDNVEKDAMERLLEISGTVQGVGFRPFVARLAARLGLRGWVRNDGQGVTVRVSGGPLALEKFSTRLQVDLPPAARVVSMHRRSPRARGRLPAVPGVGFVILPSKAGAGVRATAITPDLALCDKCRRELGARRNRRYSYPFINCTDCGPRYSIVEGLPYDRGRTTMAEFRMCAACAREFNDPAGRRFHAQPNACPECGPQVTLRDGMGRVLAGRDAAILAAAEALRAGRIVVVKGVGGFHLMVDASDGSAVRELRRRKHREAKPLAVMFPSVAALKRAVCVSRAECRELQSAGAPIVLVRRRAAAAIAEAVAPGNPWIGALLPYTPLHVLLLAAVGRPLVATSGNLSEEPLCTDDAEARERLQGMAELFLGHDRRIAHPVDDSVVRVGRAGVVMLRRARGFAPAPFRLPRDAEEGGPLLCVGGQLKNSIGVTVGKNVVLSPHLGDLGNPVAVRAFRRAAELLGKLHGLPYERVACDLHPEYSSTHYARSLGLPVVRVQHHLAHVLSCLLENGGGPRRVLGVAWDGTGYGSDGTIWGGEFIVVDRQARMARRVGHLRSFQLPGGEAAVREPRRSALGVLQELAMRGEAAREERCAALGFSAYESSLLHQALRRGVNAPVTTSAGRLFDAVAAILGLRLRSSFEGQAAMELEFAAEHSPIGSKPWIMPIERGIAGAMQLDWRPAMDALLHARERSREDTAMLAARFHATLAHGIAALARQVAVDTVVLTGGCFQNVRLLEMTAGALRRAGFHVMRHGQLPPNDGGLAAGQALGERWGIVHVADAGGTISDGCKQGG